TGNSLLGVGSFAAAPFINADYKRGYLCGLIRGDALLKIFRYSRAGRVNGDQFHFRLALVDLEPLLRARAFLLEFEVATREFLFQDAFAMRPSLVGICTPARANFQRIP